MNVIIKGTRTRTITETVEHTVEVSEGGIRALLDMPKSAEMWAQQQTPADLWREDKPALHPWRYDMEIIVPAAADAAV